MKVFNIRKKGLFFVPLLAVLCLAISPRAYAAGLSLQCPTSDGEFVNFNSENCDLSVDKQVSVNGGAFVEADTSAAAAGAHVGDTVTWQITVTNTDPDFTPHGTVYIRDLLPTGVTFNSYTATAGTYHNDDGTFFANNWILPMLQTVGQDTVTTLPATLTITTHASSVGLFDNIAVFSKYDTGSCDGGCLYQDANPDNDSNDAWVNIEPAPQVLGESTTATPQVLGLVNTGSGITESFLAGILILATISLAAYSRVSRSAKRSYKL